MKTNNKLKTLNGIGPEKLREMLENSEGKYKVFKILHPKSKIDLETFKEAEEILNLSKIEMTCLK